MSVNTSNEAIILNIAHDNSDITIRIDRDSAALDQLDEPPVINLVLQTCADITEAFDKLSEAIDRPIEYKVIKEAGKTTARFWVNFMPDELSVKCAHVAETLSDYTSEDLKRKCRRLAQLYRASVEQNELNVYLYGRLRGILYGKASKEIERYEHKIDFVRKTSTEKAARLTGQVEAYQTVIALMGLGQVDGQPIDSQISDWISRIWDDRIENQSAYAKLIASKIASMGEAALFPLLHMLTHSSPFVRAEVVSILGLIDPTVKEEVMRFVRSSDEDAPGRTV